MKPDRPPGATRDTELRPSYVLELRAEPGVDGYRALRKLLRYAGRALGLRCVALVEQ